MAERVSFIGVPISQFHFEKNLYRRKPVSILRQHDGEKWALAPEPDEGRRGVE
jgi:hypothetical protein